MNLVLALLVLGGSGVAVWAGITDPEGGTLAGVRRALLGEPQQRRTSSAARTSFLASLASTVTPPPMGGVTGTSAGGRYNLGPVKPHVAAAAAEIGPMFGITTILGVGSRSNASDHPAGLALDFMVSDPRGDALAAYVLVNGARLGVTYVIWRQRINSLDGRGWRPMEDRGSDTANHFDHVHVSFAARGGSWSA